LGGKYRLHILEEVGISVIKDVEVNRFAVGKCPWGNDTGAQLVSRKIAASWFISPDVC
jgi:hypothetical protein